MGFSICPRHRWSGLVVFFVAVLLAVGSLCVFLFFPRGNSKGTGEGSGLGSLTVPLPGTQGVSFKVGPAWTRATRDGVEGLQRSVDGGTLFVGIFLEAGNDARERMSKFVDVEQGSSAPEAEVRPYRWIRKPEDPPALGLIGFEVVLKDADSKKPRQEDHHLWVQGVCPAHHLALLTTSKRTAQDRGEDCAQCDAAVAIRVLHLAYTCMEDQAGAVDSAENMIKTLAFP